MNEHHYQRIDKGVQRKRPDLEKLARERARTENGTFLPIVSLERRSAIILEALEALKLGETTDQIAQRHGIASRTLRSWLIAHPEADEARGQFLSYELAYQLEQIENATEPMPLARAREAFRAWSWIAERRESRLFGQKQELNVNHNQPVLNITIVNNQVDTPALSTSGVMSSPALIEHKQDK